MDEANEAYEERLEDARRERRAEEARRDKDAERYRKLRHRRVNPYAVLPCGESLDAHIDAWE